MRLLLLWPVLLLLLLVQESQQSLLLRQGQRYLWLVRAICRTRTGMTWGHPHPLGLGCGLEHHPWLACPFLWLLLSACLLQWLLLLLLLLLLSLLLLLLRLRHFLLFLRDSRPPFSLA